jgi:hypothetical protein
MAKNGVFKRIACFDLKGVDAFTTCTDIRDIGMMCFIAQIVYG